jgi:hypothetical protein
MYYWRYVTLRYVTLTPQQCDCQLLLFSVVTEVRPSVRVFSGRQLLQWLAGDVTAGSYCASESDRQFVAQRGELETDWLREVLDWCGISVFG